MTKYFVLVSNLCEEGEEEMFWNQTKIECVGNSVLESSNEETNVIGMRSGSGTRECITLSMQTGASTCIRNKNAWECIHDHRIMYVTHVCYGYVATTSTSC